MTSARIAELLKPFHLKLDEFRLDQISTYVDLLQRWNAHINLTAIRDPEEMVPRHLGESLFTAKYLFPDLPTVGADPAHHLVDVGSGPGFPGLPIKLWNPHLRLTLIESSHKKATFLREVGRALALTNLEVFSARAETFPPATADLISLRAVEKFDSILPIAAHLLRPQGRLVLLIGSSQVERTHRLMPDLAWNPAIPIPCSQSRVLLVGSN